MPTKNNSPNLDQYIPEGRKRYVSYYEGAQMYGLVYTGFVKACTLFVKSKFLKLNSSHIEYVIDCMQANTTKVRNIKKYLLTALFNAPTTISSYYQAAVNYDFPQYAKAK